MGIFSRKETVDLKEFCRDIYDIMFMRRDEYTTEIKTILIGIDNVFNSLDNMKLANQLFPLQFELFALAWTHKFMHGIHVITQSVFTKQYLYEKKRDDIWNGMEEYTKLVNSATLNWLTGLSKMNMAYNYNMKKSISENNIKEAQEVGMNLDDSIERVNKRVWSENACKQKLVWGAFMITLCERLEINWNELNQEKRNAFVEFLYGHYNGAKRLIENIKIKR